MRICSECKKECSELVQEEQEHFEIRGTNVLHTFRYVVSDCCHEQIWESAEDLPESTFTELNLAIEEATYLAEVYNKPHSILSAGGDLLYVVDYDDLRTNKYRNYKLLESIQP